MLFNPSFKFYTLCISNINLFCPKAFINGAMFVLVEWKGEQSRLNVLSLNQFVKIKKNYDLEKFYKVAWPVNNKKYMSKMLLIG